MAAPPTLHEGQLFGYVQVASTAFWVTNTSAAGT